MAARDPGNPGTAAIWHVKCTAARAAPRSPPCHTASYRGVLIASAARAAPGVRPHTGRQRRHGPAALRPYANQVPRSSGPGPGFNCDRTATAGGLGPSTTSLLQRPQSVGGTAFPAVHQVQITARSSAQLHLRVMTRSTGPGDQPEKLTADVLTGRGRLSSRLDVSRLTTTSGSRGTDRPGLARMSVTVRVAVSCWQAEGSSPSHRLRSR
jgi:hypothetical protein